MTQIGVSEIAAPASQTPHPLVGRIVRLRGRVRSVVGLHGAGLVVATAVGGMFILMLLDYLAILPGWVRLVLLLAAIVGLAFLVWRRLMLPLTTRLTDQFLASRVENVNKQLADELMSAVNFIHSGAAATNALAARHIELAAKKTAGIRFEDAVDYRQASKSAGIGGLVVVIVTIVALANPALASIAFHRWFTPGGMPWPHTSHVTFQWSTPDGKPPRVLPLGEKFTVRAKVDQGSRPRVKLTSWTDTTGSNTQLMTFQKEQSTGDAFIFETALEPEGSKLSLHIVAGDDTEEPTVTIGLAPRPVITGIQGEIHAPPYAKNVNDPTKAMAATVVNLLNQSGRATQGATISLHVRASKPFLINAKGEPEVALYDLDHDEPLALAVSRTPEAANDAVLSFVADKTIQARMLMKDKDGFENRVGGTVTVEVVPDAVPSIVITDPRRSVERAPNGIVELAVQTTDDWGFVGLKLRADRFDAAPDAPPTFETNLPWESLTADAAVGSVTGHAKYTWDLTSLKLDPGMRLTFYAMVKDNFSLSGPPLQEHEWVKSAPLSLQIRGASEIQETQRKALSELNDRLRGLKLQQEQTRAQADSIRRIAEGSNQISAEQQAQLSNLAQQQTQEATAAEGLRQRAEQISEELRQNKMQEGELGKIAQDVNAGMRDVGQQKMPRAASELQRAGQNQNAGSRGQNTPSPQDAQQATEAMKGATQQQDQAIAKMDDLIKKLGAVGDFASLKNDTQRALETQRDLTKRTQQMAPKAMGTQRESLPKDVRDQEDKLAAEQMTASEKAAELMERMEQAAGPLNSSDPASAQSLQSAANAGRSSQVSGNQKSASNSLSQNKVEDSGKSQQAAQQGLQQMMDELNKNDLRKLEQLAREVRELIEDVQKLRDDEDTLNKDTVAAGAAAAKPAVQKLADRQGTLQLNSVIVQKKAQSTQGAAQAAAFIGEASDDMVAAATALFSSKQAESLKPQIDAVAALEQALAELKKLEAQVAPQVKNQQLAEFIKQYEEIKKDETAVKTTTDELEAKRLAAIDKELDRGDEQRVGRLAKTQGGLAERIAGISQDEKLKEVAVVVWMNSQVTESMEISKGGLEKLQLGKQTAKAQDDAIERLQLIIDALKEEQARPPEFGNDPSGGGGGGQGGQPPPLVPPLAQLKLLKAMQVVVNGQTKAVDQSLKGAGNDADRNQYQNEAQNLGDKEGRIQTMAGQIVEQLLQRQPGGAPRAPGNP